MASACTRRGRLDQRPLVGNHSGPVERRLALTPEIVDRAKAIVRRSQQDDPAAALAAIEDVLAPALEAGLALFEDLYAADAAPVSLTDPARSRLS